MNRQSSFIHLSGQSVDGTGAKRGERPFPKLCAVGENMFFLLLLISALCVSSNGHAAAAAAATVSKIKADEHFPLIPDIPISGSATKARWLKGDSAFNQVVDSFVLIMDNVTEIEEQLLRNDVIGEPLSYQDMYLGMYR